MGYILSAEAEADLEEIGDFIAQDNPHRADTIIDEIRARFEEISRMPLAYVARPEIDPGVRVHSWKLRDLLLRYEHDRGDRSCSARCAEHRSLVSIVGQRQKCFQFAPAVEEKRLGVRLLRS